MLSGKLKGIFANKEMQQHFLETFGQKKTIYLTKSKMPQAKLKADKFLQSLFSKVGSNCRVCNCEISGKLCWIMSALFKENIVDKKGFSISLQSIPPLKMNPACDHPNCTQPANVSSSKSVRGACGHSFHLLCYKLTSYA